MSRPFPHGRVSSHCGSSCAPGSTAGGQPTRANLSSTVAQECPVAASTASGSKKDPRGMLCHCRQLLLWLLVMGHHSQFLKRSWTLRRSCALWMRRRQSGTTGVRRRCCTCLPSSVRCIATAVESRTVRKMVSSMATSRLIVPRRLHRLSSTENRSRRGPRTNRWQRSLCQLTTSLVSAVCTRSKLRLRSRWSRWRMHGSSWRTTQCIIICTSTLISRSSCSVR